MAEGVFAGGSVGMAEGVFAGGSVGVAEGVFAGGSVGVAGRMFSESSVGVADGWRRFEGAAVVLSAASSGVLRRACPSASAALSPAPRMLVRDSEPSGVLSATASGGGEGALSGLLWPLQWVWPSVAG